jgi:polyisoprenoid-binding protein YceI
MLQPKSWIRFSILPFITLLSASYSHSSGVDSKYICKNTWMQFFSSTPIEDIKAESIKGVGVIDFNDGSFKVKVSNNSFEFPNKLMQEHYNENYMESDQYPYSSFEGRITLPSDTTLFKKGTSAPVEGIMDIHGVKKNYSVLATFKKQNDGSILAETKFNIKNADHKIEIPSIMMQKISEFVELKVKLTCTPK